MGLVIALVLTVLFLVGGLLFGRMNDRKHLASIARREERYRDIRLDNRKRVDMPEDVEVCALVIGQYVSASDYFKAFATRLRALVGGEMNSMITLMERARREAVLRMVESALKHGATEVWNIRFETSNISQMNGKRGAAQVEIIAYGTAIKRKAVA
ncbi:MAG: YbjQ family protein [Phycisphaeraceae bacterium]|nr:YbjQ family protein [Phycisphaeraceae bacterium]